MSLRTRQSLKLLNCIIFKTVKKSSSRIVTVTSSCVNVEYCITAVSVNGPSIFAVQSIIYISILPHVSRIEKRKLEEENHLPLRKFT